MNKKAVKIDLSTFFHDERKMTCVLVDPNWKSVECLQKRIEYLFGVECVRFLSDGYFLPPQESIEIVKFCNDLKAFVPKDALEKRKKKKSKKSKNSEKSIDEEGSNNDEASTAKEELINDSHKKRKYNHVSKSLSNQAKRSKSSNTLSEITSTSEQIPLSTFLQDVHELKSKKSKTKKSNVSIISSNQEEEKLMEECPMQESYSEIRVNKNVTNLEENTLTEKNSVDEPKKRLTSTPKEKKISEIVKDREEKTFNDEMKTTAARHSSIPSSTFLNESKMLQQHSNANQSTNSPKPNNPFKRSKSNRAHIYFNETGEVISPSTKSNTKSAEKKDKTIVIFRCPLREITNGLQPQKPRIFNLKSKNITKNQIQKQVVEIQEEIIISAGLTVNANKVSSSKEAIVMKENEQQQQTNVETTKVAEETNSLNEKSSLNNTSIDTENTTIAKKNSDHVGETSAQNGETNITTQSQNESQLQLTTANETSIMSVDCVDLSIDLDEYDNMEKIKTTPSKLKRIAQEKHDLTKDDEDNNSTTSSDVEEISEIIDLNETEDNCEESVNNSTIHSTSLKDIKVDKILPFSTDMTDMPSIGDIIVFKIRYVNKKQQSVQTNYIAGKTEYINRRTKTIKILVIDGFSELSYIPNHFICNLDDSQDYIKYIQIKLSDMFGLKLFPMS